MDSYDPANDIYHVIAPPADGFNLTVDVAAIPPGAIQDIYNTLPDSYAYISNIPSISSAGIVALVIFATAALSIRKSRKKY